MIFITKDDIVEVSEWSLKSNEIFGDDCFHETLNPIFAAMNAYAKPESIKEQIKKQIESHPNYIDLRELQLTDQDLQKIQH